MIHQRQKDLLLFVISKASVFNHCYRKYVSPWKNKNGKGVHLNLGCGDKYCDYFVNIDANPLRKLDLWLDIRNGLPFGDQSVDSIYTAQMLEHFYPNELARVLSECRRVLKSDAGMRIVVPSLENAIAAYSLHKVQWFSDWPRSNRSIGGRFSNFIFCDGQHRNAFDFEYMSEILLSAGFSGVEKSRPGASRLYPAEALSPSENDQHDPSVCLYMEAFC
ncbi:MAG TPA: methyltransferase domain-containing protein [Candidatus Acidoferrum sp.]|nr:methyltransferase domain-containing protein [Candidatus Acidoferrum sp.]